MLEEELIMARPPHDDIKDALSAAVEILIKPRRSASTIDKNVVQFQPNRRFGGLGAVNIGR